MNSILKKPITILIAVNLLVGFFVYRDYGLAWDEPYFYSYGDALGYAYNPINWFSGDFDLNNSYGVSGDDHKTRGPAYLFLARNFVYGLEALGSDSASAWHLVNFLFFQLGIYLLYRLATRWMSSSAAFAAALFFSTQPLLWGHAFINPKDPPFLTFFLGAICFGFEMVDAIARNDKNRKSKILLAAFFLGIATSIRVLGPLAGMLVFLYLSFSRFSPETGVNQYVIRNTQAWRSFLLYGAIAILIMFATWPYLWENPIANFFGVFRFMSDNPTNLAVLFNGEVYRAGELPRRYLPFMLGTTLTEPVWILFFAGLVVGYWKLFSKKASHAASVTYEMGLISLTLVLSWLLILLAYVFLRRPAMYDGLRHFLFILPPVFLFIGLAFEFLFELIKKVKDSSNGKDQPAVALLAGATPRQFGENLRKVINRSGNLPIWLHAGLLVVWILPAIFNIIRLHPYQYTYYNSFIGGTDGAFRNYETDYWLTCYKEAVEELNERTTEPVTLFVKREAYIAATYANDNFTVREWRDAAGEIQPGEYLLINARTNEDRTTLRDAPVVIRVGRGDATFCIVRQIP